jgi:flagellar FliL protein
MLIRSLIILILAMASSFSAFAEEEKGKIPEFSYYTLAPEITTNIYTKGKTLGYLQVRIDLMVADKKNLEELERHDPLIRDTAIELIGKQTEEQVRTLAGREMLRKQLLEKLNAILVAETGQALIADLLFTKYLYQ